MPITPASEQYAKVRTSRIQYLTQTLEGLLTDTNWASAYSLNRSRPTIYCRAISIYDEGLVSEILGPLGYTVTVNANELTVSINIPNLPKTLPENTIKSADKVVSNKETGNVRLNIMKEDTSNS